MMNFIRFSAVILEYYLSFMNTVSNRDNYQQLSYIYLSLLIQHLNPIISKRWPNNFFIQNGSRKHHRIPPSTLKWAHITHITSFPFLKERLRITRLLSSTPQLEGLQSSCFFVSNCTVCSFSSSHSLWMSNSSLHQNWLLFCQLFILILLLFL